MEGHATRYTLQLDEPSGVSRRASAITKAEAGHGQVSAPFNLPSPTGGINARDNFTDMDEKDAVDLINVFPEANSVVVRNGFTSASRGLGAEVETLLVWRGIADRLANGYNAVMSSAMVWMYAQPGSVVRCCFSRRSRLFVRPILTSVPMP